MRATELCEDVFHRLGPYERLWAGVVLVEVAVDGGLQVDDGGEDTAANAPSGENGEEILDSIEPGTGGGSEMEHPAGMPGEPVTDFRVLVGGIVVEHGMDELAGRHLSFDGFQEADEFLVGVLLHAAPQHPAVQYVEGGEQGGGPVALVVVGHGPAFAGLERQSGLGAVERLDLRLFVDRQHHRMGGRMHVEADDVLYPRSGRGQALLGEGRIVGALEGAQSVGLQFMGFPDPLDGPERQPCRLGHGPAGPVGDLARRLRASGRHDLGDDRQGHRRLAGLAAAFAQQPVDTTLGVMPLPAPHRWPANFGAARHLQNWQSVGRIQDDPGALHVLERPAAIADDRGKARAVGGGNDHGNGLCHANRLVWPNPIVNPMIGSLH